MSDMALFALLIISLVAYKPSLGTKQICQAHLYLLWKITTTYLVCGWFERVTARGMVFLSFLFLTKECQMSRFGKSQVTCFD